MQKKRIATEIFTESVNSTMLRFIGYTLAVFVITASLPHIIRHGDITIFKENQMIEWLQFGMLMGVSGVFLLGAFVVSHFRQLFLLLLYVSAFAAFRELDSPLDRMIPWIGWKIGFVFPLYAAGFSYANRRVLKRQIPPFFSSRAMALLWAGFIVAVPFSQLVGHGDFLKLLMGDDYTRHYKRVIEEIGELMGYILLFTGSVEAVVQMRLTKIRSLAASGREKGHPTIEST